MRDHRLQEKEVLKEQVKQLYYLAPIGLTATVSNSLFVFLVMKEVTSTRTLGAWLAALLAVTLLRGSLFTAFRRVNLDLADARIWGRRFTISLFLVGVVWGCIGLLPFSFSIAHQVFLAFVLGGMAAGASSAFSKLKWEYWAYSIPALTPLALHFFLIHDAFHYAMGAMVLLYLVLLGRLAKHNYAINRSSLLLRFENVEMIESLKGAKEALEASNRQLSEEIRAKMEAEAELRAHHEQLERMVRERTADLIAANEELQEAQAKLTKAKEAAEAGNLAKSEFLANMSHEMRTPLAGVLGMIRLVLDMKIGEEERSLLGMARHSAESLLRIIGDLLDFSRLEAGMMKFENKPFSVSEALRTAVEVVSFSAQERGLRLSWQVEDALPEVEGDQGRVRQVLVNLLGNAVKFTERGGIEVSAARFHDPQAPAGDFILFTIRDTGVGIEAGQLERIFGKFTQIDSSLTRKHGGTGLGLALSRQIVEKAGGRIWAESEVGSGSVFYFTIPIAPY
jgi:signal transduction histidine kinase